jgi:hypothetical protein
MVVDFIALPTAERSDRLLARMGGRLSERFGLPGAGLVAEAEAELATVGA